MIFCPGPRSITGLPSDLGLLVFYETVEMRGSTSLPSLHMTLTNRPSHHPEHDVAASSTLWNRLIRLEQQESASAATVTN